MKSQNPPATASSDTAPTPSFAESPRQISRLELAFAIVLTLLAAALRLVHLERVAIEHFDEGVYAANFYAIELDDSFPDRHLYAPPLLPLLIEYSIVLGGGLHAAAWVNLAAGIALVPVLWWAERSWFGPVAGVTAAALCTFNDVHLLYSRTSLTDPLLTLLIVLSVHMIWRTICQGGVFTTLLSGLLVGAAWWTKYNGWLPLAIAIAGFVGWMSFGVLPQTFADDLPASRKERRHASTLSRSELLRVLGPRLLIICLLAIACWAPYVWSLQKLGGYASVSTNHARYVVGPAGWWGSFLAQSANLRLLEGPLTILGMGIAALAMALVAPKTIRRNALQLVAGGLAACVLSAWLGSAAALLVVGIWGLWQVFMSRETAGRESAFTSSESNLAAWMLSAWFVSLLVVTPLYHPYSRLTLPWLAAGWLMAGMSASLLLARMQLVAAGENSLSPHRGGIWVWPTIAASIAVLIWQGPVVMSRGTAAWGDRTAIQKCAPLVLDAAMQHEPTFADNNPDQVDAVFYVLAEPAMFVQLSALQMQSPLNYVAQPASSLGVTSLASDPGFVVYLVVGPHALGDERELTAIENILLVESFPYQPSDLVWLDEHPGIPVSDGEADDPRWQFRLYRITPQ